MEVIKKELVQVRKEIINIGAHGGMYYKFRLEGKVEVLEKLITLLNNTKE